MLKKVPLIGSPSRDPTFVFTSYPETSPNCISIVVHLSNSLVILYLSLPKKVSISYNKSLLLIESKGDGASTPMMCTFTS